MEERYCGGGVLWRRGIVEEGLGENKDTSAWLGDQRCANNDKHMSHVHSGSYNCHIVSRIPHHVFDCLSPWRIFFNG